MRLLAQRLEEEKAPVAPQPVAAVQPPAPVIQRREAVQRPLIAIRPEGSLPPLFFTHTILGDVVFVRQFLPYLPPEQPLYAIQARGLEGDDPPHTDFEEMASDFVKLIRRVQPAGPYFLAGLCDGSLTAVEMARILRAAGEEVAFVGLIDPRANPVEVPWLYWKNPEAPPRASGAGWCAAAFICAAGWAPSSAGIRRGRPSSGRSRARRCSAGIWRSASA